MEDTVDNTKDVVYSGGLSSFSERVLQRYYDQDSRLWVKLTAHFFLKTNKLAPDYIRSLEEQGTLLRIWAKEQSDTGLDCWDAVEQRIGQEERARVFLGERKQVKERPGVFTPITWGLSGALASAALVFGIMTVDDTGVSGPSSLASNSSSVASIPVVARGQEPALPVTTVANRRNMEVEVDWLLSDGSVRMIQGARGEVPIIWIKQRRRIPSRRSVTQIPRALVVRNE